MMIPVTRALPALILGLALAGCEATGNTDLESRDFTVQQTSVPASEAMSSTEQITGLVRNSGPTYVTLVVSEKESQGSRTGKDASRGVAVTSGSGFIVDGAGHVMTAAHVAKKAGNTVSARAANGRLYSGTVIAILPENDMALIKLRGFSGKSVTPAGSQCVARGSMVYSLGRPHAQGDTARIGSLESMHFGRAVAYGKFGYPDAMVLRMNTQKGESGGPLFNKTGELVGMVVSTLTDANGNLINLAHAIPASRLANFFCGNASCGGSWASLSQTSTDACPSG
jgi:S1-C subfamily serine protease